MLSGANSNSWRLETLTLKLSVVPLHREARLSFLFCFLTCMLLCSAWPPCLCHPALVVWDTSISITVGIWYLWIIEEKIDTTQFYKFLSTSNRHSIIIIHRNIGYRILPNLRNCRNHIKKKAKISNSLNKKTKLFHRNGACLK
jgi:hypothetical protein